MNFELIHYDGPSLHYITYRCPGLSRQAMNFVHGQTRNSGLDFRRMQVASDQVTFLVESSDDITQDSEVFVPIRIVLDSVSLTRSYK